jgi:hypothetical protein
LATDLADPAERLRKIHASSTASKNMMSRIKAAIPTDFPLLGAPWLISGMASMMGRSRLANVIPPVANLVISNVAGIPAQLYFAGAKVVSYYPVSIPAHGMALNVTVQSYNGRLDYGLIACRRAVPDVNELGDYLLAEHRKLLELALAQPEPVVEAVKPTAAAKPEGRKVSKPSLAPTTAEVTALTAKPTPSRSRRPAQPRVVKPKIGLVA